MSQRPYCFIVALIFIFNGEIFSQEIPHIGVDQPYPQVPGNAGLRLGPQKSIFSAEYCSNSVIKTGFHRNFISPLTENFYVKNLSFICLKEVQLQKITTIPFRFRLGSLDYVNFLEQKPNALRPY